MKVTRSLHEQIVVPPERYLLRLYVAGPSQKSMHAITNIKNICETHLKDCYQLEVIDLYQQPERAKTDQIIAVPTLVKELPVPGCRIIGDLSNEAQVCASLDIRRKTTPGNGLL